MDNRKDSRTRREEIRVVDRRFFTPEGVAREDDGARDDSVTAPDDAGPAATSSAASSGRPGISDQGNADAPRRSAGLHGPSEPARASLAPPDAVAAAHFKNLILNLATSAAANLGEIPNPYSQQTEVDLEGARQLIDLLQALKVKTEGNLNQEEAALLDSLLYDLQMKFVSLQSKTPNRP